MVSGELHLHTGLPSPFLCSLFSSHGIPSLCSPFLRSVPPQGISFQFILFSLALLQRRWCLLVPLLPASSPGLLIPPHRQHSRPWPCVLPACQTLTHHTFHHCALECLVTLAVFPCLRSVFCLLWCSSSRNLRAAWAAVAAVLASVPGMQQGLWENHEAKQTPSTTTFAPSFLLKIRWPAAFLHALLCLSVRTSACPHHVPRHGPHSTG